MTVRQQQNRLLMTHYALYQMGTSLAGGFLGAFFLKCGFSLVTALIAYTCYLFLRSGLRFAALEVVRRIGYKRALALGTATIALQFLPLMHAEHLFCLGLWMLCVALGESLYWPIYHAIIAVSDDSETRGRQIGRRTTISALINVTAPLAGAVLLSRFGAAANFSLATALTLLAVLPLLSIQALPTEPIPSIHGALRETDRLSLLAFAADGWLCSGLIVAWPMILFATLGSHYEALGMQNAAAGIAGAVASFFCGRHIDRGQRTVYLNSVCIMLAVGFVLRSLAAWSPWSASLANLSGAVVGALYNVVLMSVIYDRAKRSGEAFRFHFAAEAGWDAGAVAGCLVAALTAGLCRTAPSLTVLPAMAGIALTYVCVRAGTGPTARGLARVPGEATYELLTTEALGTKALAA